MKKQLTFIAAIIVTVSMAIAGCAKAPAPAPTPTPAPAPAPAPSPTPAPTPTPTAGLTAADEPELQSLIAGGQMDGSLLINPFGSTFLQKPDGTPITIAVGHCFLGNEWTANAHGVAQSYVERAGGIYKFNDPNLDPAAQVSWIEDMVASKGCDIMIVQGIEEKSLKPALTKVVNSGIPVFMFDFVIKDPTLVSGICYHYMDGPAGTNVLGEQFDQIQKATNKPMNILEIWGDRSNDSSQARHKGLHSVVDLNPNIKVIESADSKWVDSAAASEVIANFTAHPELNAIYEHGGSGAGPVEGLKSINRLFPVGDPKHVTICTNDEGTAAYNYTKDGFVDAFGTHQSWDLIDGVLKLAMNKAVIGRDVTFDSWIPMVAVTHDNLNTLSIFKVAPGWPWMPQGKWDLWPVMDLTSLPSGGIQTPTLADRKAIAGY